MSFVKSLWSCLSWFFSLHSKALHVYNDENLHHKVCPLIVRIKSVKRKIKLLINHDQQKIVNKILFVVCYFPPYTMKKLHAKCSWLWICFYKTQLELLRVEINIKFFRSRVGNHKKSFFSLYICVTLFVLEWNFLALNKYE